MTIARSNDPLRQPLRLWPGVVAVLLQWLGLFAAPRFISGEIVVYFVAIGGLLGTLGVLLWWMFFSRAPWSERLGAVALVIVAMAVTQRLLHRSVAEGNLGFQYFLFAIPTVCLAVVVWAAVFRRFSNRLRRPALAAAILLACGMWTLVRSKGLTGDGSPEFAWRWAETAEERLLAQGDDEMQPIPSAPAPPESSGTSAPGGDAAALDSIPAAASKGTDWPGFRGPHRDGVIPGLRIETDWSASPPAELWRRPIGPGVSSFAVGGDLLYTQEQRGEDEDVSCYRMTTGEPVWRHSDPARFWDSHVDVGPRATPALSEGRVYTLGATGILNALDARNGTVVWSRNAASDTDAKLPMFGFVSSPLVVDDEVIVHTNALVAYDLTSGDRRWTGPKNGSYCSPQLLTLGGIPQILLLSHDGVAGVAPADGKLLWEHPWPGIGILQPALTADGDLLISMVADSAAPIGTRRLTVAHGAGRWSVEERWESKGLKPSFSPLVVHKGHAFGFDGRFLACIELENGKRKWKGGRYGSGQILLLPDQDLLLVVSERGELALVGASPDRFNELTRFPAIEGKTWNQPALVGDVLLVRNGQEMAAFRLPLAGG